MQLINKQEKKDLEKYGYKLSNRKPNGLIIEGLIVISHGNKNLHDSGYPFIKIFGIYKNELVFLGKHDHWISYITTTTDSFGKNIFRIFKWLNMDAKWKIIDDFFPVSTFQIGNFFTKKDDKIIPLS